MSSFGRGVRLELCRQEVNLSGGSGFSTVLSVPSNANYFIFINDVHTGINNSTTTNLNIYREQYGNSGSLGDFSTGGNVGPLAGNANAGWIDYLAGPIGDEDNPFNERIIIPGGYAGANRGAAVHYLNIWYTKVYFGGLSDY